MRSGGVFDRKFCGVVACEERRFASFEKDGLEQLIGSLFCLSAVTSRERFAARACVLLTLL